MCINCKKALAEYEKITDPALAKYRKICDQEWAKYEKITDSAEAKYEKIRDMCEDTNKFADCTTEELKNELSRRREEKEGKG